MASLGVKPLSSTLIMFWVEYRPVKMQIYITTYIDLVQGTGSGRRGPAMGHRSSEAMFPLVLLAFSSHRSYFNHSILLNSFSG